MFRDAEELYGAPENSFCEGLWRQISALLAVPVSKYAFLERIEIQAIVARLRGDRQTMIGDEVRS